MLEHHGKTVGSEEIGGIHQLKMEMGRAGISRVPDLGDTRTLRHLVSRFHADRTFLKMAVSAELTVSVIDDHVIPGHGIGPADLRDQFGSS